MFCFVFGVSCGAAEKLMSARSERVFSRSGMVRVLFTTLLSAALLAAAEQYQPTSRDTYYFRLTSDLFVRKQYFTESQRVEETAFAVLSRAAFTSYSKAEPWMISR